MTNFSHHTCSNHIFRGNRAADRNAKYGVSWVEKLTKSCSVLLSYFSPLISM